MELGAAQHRGEELWNHVQVVVGWEEDFSSVHPSRGPYCSSRREERCCAHPPRNGRVVGPRLSRAQSHSWPGWWSPTGKKEPPSTSRGFACRSQGCPILLCCQPLLPHPDILSAHPAPSHHPASPSCPVPPSCQPRPSPASCPLPGHSRCRTAASRAPHPPAWAAAWRSCEAQRRDGGDTGVRFHCRPGTQL